MKIRSRVESSKITNRRDKDMNGKLAKQIRREVNFNPNAAREYRRVKRAERVAPTGRVTPNGIPEITWVTSYTEVSTGCRAAYQKLKTSVLAAKRNRDGREGRHA